MAKKPETSKDTLPTIDSLRLDAGTSGIVDRSSLLDELEADLRQLAEYARLDKLVKPLRKQVADIYDLLGIYGVQDEFYTYALKHGTSPSQLSKTLLAEAGVDPDVIERCVVPGTPYVTVEARLKK